MEGEYGGSPRRRWATRLAVGLLACGLLLWWAPSLVVHTGWGQRLVARLTTDFDGHIAIGSTRLGWFSPVTLQDVVVADAQGQPLLEAAALTSERTLIGLILARQRMGDWRVEQPHLHLVLRSDGSNLEDALLPLWNALAAQSGEPRGWQCRIEVVDGTIGVRPAGPPVESGSPASFDRPWQVSQIQALLDLPLDSAASQTLRFSGRIVAPATHGAPATRATVQPEADLVAELAWQAGEQPGASLLACGQATVQANRLPLDVFQPLVQRWLPEVRLNGTLTADCRYQWNGGGKSHRLHVEQLVADQLQLAAPQWLGEDQLELDRLKTSGRGSLDGDRWQVQALAIDSELARLQASGRGTLTAWDAERPLAEMATWFEQQDYQIQGRVDLARLARVLPQTLHLREGTQVTAGEVHLVLAAEGQSGRRRWQGQLKTSDLSADHHGTAVTWEHPVQIELTAERTPDGLVVERLSCDSSFLRVAGHGRPEQATLTATGDLDRLAAELGQFVDLQPWKLAGQWQADLSWQCDGQRQLDARGELLVQDFQVAGPGMRPWQEQRLEVSLTAAGLADRQRIERIDRATARLRSGQDQLDARLLQAVAEPSAQTEWPVEWQIAGNLESWLPRLELLLPLPDWELAGSGRASAQGTFHPEQLHLERVTLELQPLQVRAPGWEIDEPQVTIETSAKWDLAQRRLTAGETTLVASAVACRAERLELHWQEQSLSWATDVHVRGDVNRLLRWRHDRDSPPDEQLFGQMVGRLQLSHASGVTGIQGNGQIDDLVYARRPEPAGSQSASWQTLWRESRAAVSGQASYDHRQDLLELANWELAGDALRLSGQQGKIFQPTGQPRVELAGQIGYDWQQVLQKLRPYLGEQPLEVAGQGTGSFRVDGPLPPAGWFEERDATAAGGWPHDLAAQATVAWDSAALVGLAVGPGQLQVELAEAIVRVLPLDLPVSDGRLKLAPRIRLDHTPLVLELPPGVLIQNVRMSPAMCQSWLKYLAPLVADATRAEGRFSLTLEGAAIPLAQPATAQAQGVLAIHAGQVGPGPLARQFLTIAQQVKAVVRRRPPGQQPQATWLQLPSQDVPFQVDGQRIYHRGLRLAAGDVLIQTEGSVGMDQSLALLARVPIQDEWIAEDRLLAALKGQVVEVPIGGTLSRPQIDGRALDELAARMVGNAASQLLDDNLQRGLQQLFGPRPMP